MRAHAGEEEESVEDLTDVRVLMRLGIYYSPAALEEGSWGCSCDMAMLISETVMRRGGGRRRLGRAD